MGAEKDENEALKWLVGEKDERFASIERKLARIVKLMQFPPGTLVEEIRRARALTVKDYPGGEDVR
jgi:hypothetical protein